MRLLAPDIFVGWFSRRRERKRLERLAADRESREAHRGRDEVVARIRQEAVDHAADIFAAKLGRDLTEHERRLLAWGLTSCDRANFKRDLALLRGDAEAATHLLLELERRVKKASAEASHDGAA